MAKKLTVDNVKTKYPVGLDLISGKWCVYTNNSKAFIFRDSYTDTKEKAIKNALEKEARLYDAKFRAIIDKLEQLDMTNELDPRGFLV